jgi:hypothetical protein
MIRTVYGKTPKIHETAFISEAAYIAGDVEIGENSSVWPGTVIRGDHAPIIIGRIENERLLLDPRTVLPEDDKALLSRLRGILIS